MTTVTESTPLDIALAEIAQDPELSPDGVEVVERDHPYGLLRFEMFPAGSWRTQKGTVAKKDRRRYLLDGKPLMSVSAVTGILGADALIWWAEDHGMRGAVEAERAGLLKDVEPENYIHAVKAAGLGASAARDDGAARGHAIHAAFDTLARTGEIPNPADYPAAWRPYVQGAVRAWLHLDPSPVLVEHIVCRPDLGYAGRFDLLAECGRYDGALTLIDYKTGKGKIYDRAHYQTRLYDIALRWENVRAERVVIVGIDDEGGFSVVECAASDEDARALRHIAFGSKRIMAAQSAQLKAWKKAAA